jgi:uroporphyrin-III C-methyltransferase/precorrin-2 dehydrogenase/sirohydrochlorin ferrochelatase
MLPLALDVTDQPVLVVGAGPVGARRALTLWEAGARVRVVAPQGVAEIRVGAAVGRWAWERRGWRPGDEAGARLVCVAVPDGEVSRAVHAACRAAGVLVNVADQPELCDVHFPALVRRGPLKIAVSTDGRSPGFAAVLRDRLDGWLPASLGNFVVRLGEARDLMRARGLPEAERLRLGGALANDRAAEQALARGDDLDPAAWVARIEAKTGSNNRYVGAIHELPHGIDGRNVVTSAAADEGTATGSVAIVGAGPGRPEWLTVRAARLLAEADAVLHDALVPAEVLALCRPDCERLLVGRRAGAPHLDRDEVAELAVLRARRGLRVVRLKGGDPALFAGEGEELEALRRAGLPVEVVPGVTAALGAAAEAALALTRRDVASTVLLASAHLDPSDSRSGVDWAAAARLGGTLVLYMPGRHLRAITAALIEAGRSPVTPAAIVSGAGLPDCRVHASTLGRAADDLDAAADAGPAVIVIGEVAAPHT